MKHKLFNNYTYFLFGLALVTLATFIRLPCPACEGTGRIQGITGIEVMNIESTLVDRYELGMDCGWDYERFTYDVELTVENYTDSEAYGVILITFHDPDESYTMQVEIDDEELYVEVAGATLLSTPLFLEIPARTTRVINKRMMFEGITLEFFSGRHHQIEANLASSYTCPFHAETASVPLPEWIRLRW